MSDNHEISTTQTEEIVIIYGEVGGKPINRFEITVAELPDELTDEVVYSVLMNSIQHFKVWGNGFILSVRNEWYKLVKVRKKEYEVFKLS